MSDLTNKKIKRLDFFLADFDSIKVEIARRSNLQRVVLAAYAALFAFIFQQATKHSFSLFHVAGLWIAVVVTLLFYIRENLECQRLGKIISEKIVPYAEEIINDKTAIILPSQTDSRIPEINQLTRPLYTIFFWLVFLVLPGLISLIYLYNNSVRLMQPENWPSHVPWVVLITLIAFCASNYLLYIHVWPLFDKKEINSGDNIVK